MTSNSEIGLLYDEVPYPDLCHGPTHPGRLAAIAGLMNMEPVAAQRCRVLEIGCARGANLVPMAFGLPESTFVGLDVSGRQIDAAREFAGAVGLRNVQFHTMDLMDVGPELGTFDYIVAHGVYSWVPPEVRDQLLAVCRRHLSAMGVAYVSYNTLPGWHWNLIVREMMLYHTRAIGEPRRHARAARDMVPMLRSMIPEADRSVAASVLDAYGTSHFADFAGDPAWEESALLHDELSVVNEPVYFHQFVEHAQQHHLQYLTGATFPRAMTDGLSAEALAQLNEMAGDRIEFEQYLDFLRHGAFRRTLLCHEDVDVRPPGRFPDLGDLCISSGAPTSGDGGPGGPQADRSAEQLEHPVVAAALAHLSEVAPRAIPFADLLAEACRRAEVGDPDEAIAERLSTEVFAVASAGDERAELLGYAPVLAPVPSERPLASPIVRVQNVRSRVVCNLLHEPVALNGLSRALVPLLDGRHSRDDVLGELLAMLDDGRMSSSKPHDMPRAQIEALLADDVDSTLRWLGRVGILLR